MIRTIIIALATFILLPPLAFAGKQYLCVADKSTGFSYDKALKEWRPTTFEADSKYVISNPNDGHLAFVVRILGESWAMAKCKHDFNDVGVLFCGGSAMDFRFNRANGRYIMFHTLGYYSVLPGNQEDANTPYIEIGKCSSF